MTGLFDSLRRFPMSVVLPNCLIRKHQWQVRILIWEGASNEEKARMKR